MEQQTDIAVQTTNPDVPAQVAVVEPGATPARTKPGIDFKKLLVPILKRMPRYLRLGLALAKEPAIPNRHKSVLYGAVVYQVTPIHFLASPIPIIGQIDIIALLLLGIRQAYVNCPPDIARQHFSRLGIQPNQMDRDMAVILGLGDYTITTATKRVTRDARFLGRVASGFSRRQFGRLLTEASKAGLSSDTSS
ncbi:MAG: hypothetical protein ACLQVD_09615 [Capsulimonadaceae bacterium]